MSEKKPKRIVAASVFSGAPDRPFRRITIFGLKSAGKSGVFFSSNFRNMGNVMPVVFEGIKMSSWVRKKDSGRIFEREYIAEKSM